MKKLMSIIAGAALLASCAEESPKALVLYYSQTGATETVAAAIQAATGADIEAFDVVEAYDGDYNATIQRCMSERSSGFVPTLSPISSDLSKYDVIYLGYPIWFGSYAPPVQALLAGVDLSGKKIVPFCTFGSGGLVESSNDLKKALPQSEIAEGFGIRNGRIQYTEEEVNAFLVAGGYIEGTYEPLPGYSEQAELTEEEMAIYEEATGDYPMPIGQPLSVGSRAVNGGTDYLYVINGSGPAGNPVEGKVYVSCREGRKAEFTLVVR